MSERFWNFLNDVVELLHDRALKNAEKENRNYRDAQGKLEMFKVEGGDAQLIERQSKKVKKLVCGRYVGGPEDGKPVSHRILKNNPEYCMSVPRASSGCSGAFVSMYKRSDDSFDFVFDSTIAFPFDLAGWQKNHPGAFSNRTPDGKTIADPPLALSLLRSMPNMVLGSFLVLPSIAAALLKAFKSADKRH
jgi:hypothetical protein